jgi:hypothetical protein
MGRIKPKTVSDLMEWQTNSQTEKMRVTINARGHQKMIEEIDMEVKGEGPAITTTTAPIAK